VPFGGGAGNLYSGAVTINPDSSVSFDVFSRLKVNLLKNHPALPM
jgi:hypothetical protein